MNTRTVVLGVLTVTSVFVVATYGQGTFENLDFEAARVVFLPTNSPYGPYPYIAISNALPGWSAFFTVPGAYTNRITGILLDNADPRVTGALSLLDSMGGPLDGSFSVSLGQERNSISQSGLIPEGVHSLLFRAAMEPDSSLQVSLGGENLSYVVLVRQSNYGLYGADISTFAGEPATLTFRGTGQWSEIDDIQFSPQIVPEPSVLALAGAAASLFLCRRLGGHSR